MHVAMRTTNLFPDMVTQMVMIGEESGALDDMLAKVASIYEQQVDDAVDISIDLCKRNLLFIKFGKTIPRVKQSFPSL